MTDPLKDIEDKKAQVDMGIMAARYFQGAYQELEGNWWHAYLATCAFFVGMFRGPGEAPPTDEEEKKD